METAGKVRPRRSWPMIAFLLLAAPAGAQDLPFLPTTPRGAQYQAAQKWTPGKLSLRPPHSAAMSGEPHIIKVRVYAASDYRRATRGWPEKLRRLVSRVNQVSAAWPRVEFEVVETKDWEVDSAASNLGKLLEDLEQLDRGEDVDLVVGLAAAVPVMPVNIHNIGMARYVSRHFVMRALHDPAEYQVVQQAFDVLLPVEREAVLAARKAHKEQVVFLHEWGHTLGLIHAQRESLIMNPSYHHNQVGFGDSDAPMIAAALRLPSPAARRAELLRYLNETRDPDWDPRDRDEQLRWLGGNAAAPATVPAASAAQSITRCQIATEALARDQVSPTAEQACSDAVKAAPADAQTHLNLAELLSRRKQVNRVRSLLFASAQLLEPNPAAGKNLWGMLAWLAVRADLPTLAERAAAHADDTLRAQIVDWALMFRRQRMLPVNGAKLGVPVEREDYYVQLMATTVEAVTRRQHGAAALVSLLQREFPEAPGAPAVRCRIAFDERRYDDGARSCEEALMLQEDAIWPRWTLATIELMRDRRKSIAHLRRVIALDPKRKEAWVLLGDVYRTLGDRANQSATEAEIRTRFP